MRGSKFLGRMFVGLSSEEKEERRRIFQGFCIGLGESREKTEVGEVVGRCRRDR